MKQAKSDGGKDIAVYIGSILVISIGLVFAFTQTNMSPETFYGKLFDVINHPITKAMLVIFLILSLAGLISTITHKIRMSNAAKKSIQNSTDSIVRPIRLYTLDQGNISIPITNLGEVTDLITQLTRRGEKGIIDLVDQILMCAIRSRASDIHIEPGFDAVLVKYRLDGVLNDVCEIPKDLMTRIVSRLRVLSNLTIYERGKPQDGRLDLRIGNRNYDVRLSLLPTLHGDKTVIRLFESGDHKFDLVLLGMEPETYESYTDLLLRPQGTIFLTGPTGSGKTTTIYSAIKFILENRGETTNIVTIEDPIECEIPGINQTQVNPKRDLTFASGLRSILRQDPDVIVVGEVRDLETAEICTQAGLTGHLVVSTIHADSAVGVFNRLIDMGIEPFLVASSVSGILSQRLVRRNCLHCIQPVVPSLKALKYFNIPANADIKFMKGKGCEQCHGRGYLGRVGVFELLVINQTVRDALQQKVSTSNLMEIARQQGLRTLRDDGLAKVRAGLVDIEELARVLL